MGRSNRTEALESKIAFLMGEYEAKQAEIAKIEQQAADLAAMRERQREVETLIKACEVVIRSDQPDWTRDHVQPKLKFTHKIPVRLGTGIRQALDVLRQTGERMTVRQIAVEVLRREGHSGSDTETITKVANTIGNGLRKGSRSKYVTNDGEWPARWWVIKPE